MIVDGIFPFTQAQANVFDFTASIVYIYFAFTSLVTVVELCTLLHYEVIVLIYGFKFFSAFCLSELKVGAVNLFQLHRFALNYTFLH